MYTVQVRFMAVDEESSCTRSCIKGKKIPNNWRSTALIIADSAFPYFGVGRVFDWVTKKTVLDSMGRSIVHLNMFFSFEVGVLLCS